MGLIQIRTKQKRKKPTPKALQNLADTQASAQVLKDKWATAPKFAGKYAALPKKKLKVKEGPPALTNPPGRAKQLIPSLSTPGGEAAKRPDKVYTGTAMKGVATMHKSNSVPVFDDQHLVDIANMRRNDYTREVKKNPIDDAGILPPSDQL